MLRGYEIIDLHIVARVSEHFRGIGIKLALAVGHDYGLAAPQRLKQRISDNRTRLHGTGCAENGNMAVESGVLRHTDGFSVVLAEDRTFGIRNRRYLQNFLHFFFVHPGCRAVDTGFASGKAAGIMLLPVKLIVKLHIGEDGAGDQQDHQDAFDPVHAESRRKTNQRVPAYRLHRALAGNAAAVHPRCVVAEQLAKHAAQIEQPDASQYGGDDNGYLAVFIVQINPSFPGRVLLPQRQAQSFLLLRGSRDIPG